MLLTSRQFFSSQLTGFVQRCVGTDKSDNNCVLRKRVKLSIFRQMFAASDGCGLIVSFKIIEKSVSSVREKHTAL